MCGTNCLAMANVIDKMGTRTTEQMQKASND
jgi:hypothetical protein